MNKICQRLAARSTNRRAKSLRCSGVVVASSCGYCGPSTPDAVRISRTQAKGTTCKKFSCAARKWSRCASKTGGAVMKAVSRNMKVWNLWATILCVQSLQKCWNTVIANTCAEHCLSRKLMIHRSDDSQEEKEEGRFFWV